jgi:hypothetical protein
VVCGEYDVYEKQLLYPIIKGQLLICSELSKILESSRVFDFKAQLFILIIVTGAREARGCEYRDTLTFAI